MRRTFAVSGAACLVLAGALLLAAVPRAPGAQAPRPVLSPRDTVAATIDGASLSIAYGRPSMRGRKIFGSLVPFGRIWCPGADSCTTLTSDRDLEFPGLTLKAGDHSMWMLPTDAAWTLIFNSEGGAFHTRHDASRDVGRIELQKTALPQPVEQLTFSLERSPSGTGGVLAMEWETTRVFAPFTVR
jgi:hypothetical protein